MKKFFLALCLVLATVFAVSVFSVGDAESAYAAKKPIVLTSEMLLNTKNIPIADYVLEDDVTISDQSYYDRYITEGNASDWVTINLQGHVLQLGVNLYIKQKVIFKDTVGGGKITYEKGGALVIEGAAAEAIFENVTVFGFATDSPCTTIKNCTIGGINCQAGIVNIHNSTLNQITADDGAVVNIDKNTVIISNTPDPDVVFSGTIAVSYSELNVKGTVINNNQTVSETGDYSGEAYACIKADDAGVINVYDEAVIESKKGTVLFALTNTGVLNFADETERQVSFSAYNLETDSRESVITGLENYPENFQYEDYFTYVPIEVPSIMLRNEKTGNIDVKTLHFTQQPASSDLTVDVNIPERTTYQWKQYKYDEKRLEASDFLSFSSYDINGDEVTETSAIYDATDKVFSGARSMNFTLADGGDYNTIEEWLAQGDYAMDAPQYATMDFSNYGGGKIRMKLMDGDDFLTTDDIHVYSGTFDASTGIFESALNYGAQYLYFYFKNSKTCTLQVLTDVPICSWSSEDWDFSDTEATLSADFNNRFVGDYYFIAKSTTITTLVGETSASFPAEDFGYYACEATLDGLSVLSNIVEFSEPEEYTSEVEISVNEAGYRSTIEDIAPTVSSGEDLTVRYAEIYYFDGTDFIKTDKVEHLGEYSIDIALIGDSKPYYFSNQTQGTTVSYGNGYSCSSSLAVTTVAKGVRYYNKKTGLVTDGATDDKNVFLYFRVSFTLSGYGVLYEKNTDDAVTGMPSDESRYFPTLDVPVSASVPTRTGYTFLGWALEDDGSPILTNTVVMGEGDITFYAVWRKIYTASDFASAAAFDENGTSAGLYRLTADTTVGSMRFSEEVALDLNGYSLTITECMEVCGGKITFYDFSANQTGKIIAGNSEWDFCMFALSDHSTISFLGGTIYCDAKIMVSASQPSGSAVYIDGADAFVSGTAVSIGSGDTSFIVKTDNGAITASDSALEDATADRPLISIITDADGLTSPVLYVGENATITSDRNTCNVYLMRASMILKGTVKNTYTDKKPVTAENGCIELDSGGETVLYLYPTAVIQSAKIIGVKIGYYDNCINVQGKLTDTTDKTTIWKSEGLAIKNFHTYNENDDFLDFFTLQRIDCSSVLYKEADNNIYAKPFVFDVNPTEYDPTAVSSVKEATYQWEKMKVEVGRLTLEDVAVEFCYDTDKEADLPYDAENKTFGGTDYFFRICVPGSYEYIEVWAEKPVFSAEMDCIEFYSGKTAQCKIKIGGEYIDDTYSHIVEFACGTYDAETETWSLALTDGNYVLAIYLDGDYEIVVEFVTDLMTSCEYYTDYQEFEMGGQKIYFVAPKIVFDEESAGETKTTLSTTENGLYRCKASYNGVDVYSEILDLRMDLAETLEQQVYDYTGEPAPYTVEGLDGYDVYYYYADTDTWSKDAPTESGAYKVKVMRFGDSLYKYCEIESEDLLAITVTVTYDANTTDAYEGDLPASDTAIPNRSYEVSQNVLTREGYIFVGWGLNPYGEVAFTGVLAENTPFTLYAIWHKVEVYDGIVFIQALDETFTGGILGVGTYYLTSDIVLEKDITFSGGSAHEGFVYLYLNDKVLDLNSHYICNYTTLYIYDNGTTVRYFTDEYNDKASTYGTDGCYETYLGNTAETPDALAIVGGVITNGIGGQYRGGTIENDYNFILQSGNIVGNLSNIGAVHNSGTFTMNGGRIVGNGGADFGYGEYGTYYSGAGGVYNGNTFIMNGGEISYNVGNQGGAILNNGTAIVNGGVLSHNEAVYWSENDSYGGFGGAVYNIGFLEINGGIISDNKAVYGGAIFTYENNVIINGGTISGNKANYSAGGIFADEGSLFISNATISDNKVGEGSGAIFMQYGTLTISNSTICNNRGSGGGSIGGNNAYIIINDSTISYNKANGLGGAIYASCVTLTVNGGTISYNEAMGYSGGAIYCEDSDVLITDTVISHNKAYSGGGICLYYSNLTLTGATVSYNEADGDGGGIMVEREGDNVTIADSVISHNTAQNGGGICTVINLYFCSGTISDNTAREIGGGVYVSHNDGGFCMASGSITRNTAIIGAGICSVGHLFLVGGVITENTTSEDVGSYQYYGGAGVCACNGAIIGSGIIVKNNTTDGKEDNILLPNSEGEILITYYDLYPLQEGAYIGISLFNVDRPFIFNVADESILSFFHSDNPQFYVEKYPDGDTFFFYLEHKWTVVYDGNGAESGTAPTDEDGYFVEDEVPLAGNTGSLVKTGYRFMGWALTDDATTALKSYVVADEDATERVITFYAVWAREYSITYTLNGGTNDDDNPSEYISSEKVTLLAPTKTGNKFVGWYLDEDFTGDAVLTIEIGSAEDVSFFAKWEEKASVRISEDAQTKAYNGNTQGFELLGTHKNIGDFTVEYYVDSDWTETVPVRLGTYNVKITRAEDDEYCAYSKEIEAGLILKAKDVILTIVDIESGTFIYDGTEKTTTATYTDLVGTDELTYTLSYSDNIHAGTCEVTIASASVSKGTATNYNLIFDDTGFIVIDKLAVNEPTVLGTYVYTGSEQTATVTGKETYMTEIGDVQGTLVNTYTITYTLDENHKWADGSDGLVTWTIGKASASVTVDQTAIVKTYGETWVLPIAASTFGNVTCDKTVSDLTDAGTYTVTYSVEDTDNYIGDSKTLSVTINKLAVNEPTLSGNYKYTGEVQTPTFNGLESYMLKSGTLSATEAGVYSITISLDDNHAWADGNDGILTWEIKAVTIQSKKETEAGEEKKSQVIIETDAGFTSDILLEVVTVAEATVVEAVEKKNLIVDYYNLPNEEIALTQAEAVGVVYNVKLIQTVDGVSQEIQPEDIAPDTIIKVRMLIPEEVDITRLTRILHVHSADDIEEYTFDVTKLDENRYYEIEIDRLSEFAFIYQTEENVCYMHWLLLAFGIVILSLMVIMIVRFVKKSHLRKTDSILSVVVSLAIACTSYFLMGCSVLCFAFFITNAVLAGASFVCMIVFFVKDKASNHT